MVINLSQGNMHFTRHRACENMASMDTAQFGCSTSGPNSRREVTRATLIQANRGKRVSATPSPRSRRQPRSVASAELMLPDRKRMAQIQKPTCTTGGCALRKPRLCRRVRRSIEPELMRLCASRRVPLPLCAGCANVRRRADSLCRPQRCRG
jgi:hypothetical protein